MLWFGENRKKAPKNPLQNTKPPNQFPSEKGLPSFGLLVPVWDADLPVYRVLLSGAAALGKCDKMHVTMPPYTLSDSAFCCQSPLSSTTCSFSHWSFVICTTSLLKTQTKWVKKMWKDLVFSLEWGNMELFQGNTKLEEGDILLLWVF